MKELKINYELKSDKDKQAQENAQPKISKVKIVNDGSPEMAMAHGAALLLSTIPILEEGNDTLETSVGVAMGPDGKKYQVKIQLTSCEELMIPPHEVTQFRVAEKDLPPFTGPHGQA